MVLDDGTGIRHPEQTMAAFGRPMIRYQTPRTNDGGIRVPTYNRPLSDPISSLFALEIGPSRPVFAPARSLISSVLSRKPGFGRTPAPGAASRGVIPPFAFADSAGPGYTYPLR
jgi:hypothetical protein